jgi:hypothetical protein
VTLTFKGKLLVLVNRFIPWFVDWKAKKTVRKLFADEMAERKKKQAEQAAAAPEMSQGVSRRNSR